VQSCDNALDAIPQVSPNAEPDRGMPVSAEDLSRLNEKIIAAVKKLNTDMNTNPCGNRLCSKNYGMKNG
ncbi:MAG TPA: hypothetical protein VK826_13265, partial [Bacteroidia bacterium]|nr:hypothetical protein [Bacteroidia bacterium]